MRPGLPPSLPPSRESPNPIHGDNVLPSRNERPNEAVSVLRRLPHLGRVQLFQYFVALNALVIGAFRGATRGSRQPVKDILLEDLPDVWILRKRRPLKPGAKIPFYCLTVGQEPRLHRLHHHMTLAIRRARRAVPVVAGFQMFPCSLCYYGCLSIHQEYGVILAGERLPEIIISIPTAPAGHNLECIPC